MHHANRWRFLRSFCTADLRSLALLRVVLGALLVVDLWGRLGLVATLYSNDGVLSNHYSLFRPLAPYQFSLYVALSSTRDVTVALVLTLMVYVTFALGYRTRLFHLLSFVCVTSLHSRNLMTELPSDVPLHLWVGWSLLLPLGSRFSIDSLRRSLGEPREASVADRNAHPARIETVTSIAVAGMLLQLSAMHLVAGLRQAGPTWQDGSALYYALHQNLWVTDWGTWIGAHAPVEYLRTASFGYRTLEVVIGALVLVPVLYARRVSLGLLVAFHLTSRALWNFGPYEWVMLGGAPLFISSRDWQAIQGWYEARKRKLTMYFDADSGLCIRQGAETPAVAFDDSIRQGILRALKFSREGAALVLLLACGVALARDMNDESQPAGVESVIYRIVAYPRLFQRWGLFVPEPPKRPGMLVAEAQTADGTKLDPLTGLPPTRGGTIEGARRPDPLMLAYYTSISQPSRSTYVNELREYVRRTGDRRAPADRLVWFNVDWIEAPISAPRGNESPPELAEVSMPRRITSGP